jgi:hypothetical protein
MRFSFRRYNLFDVYEKEEVLITGITQLELEIKKKFGLRMIFSPNFFHFSLVPHRFRTFYYVVPHTGPP